MLFISLFLVLRALNQKFPLSFHLWEEFGLKLLNLTVIQIGPENQCVANYPFYQCWEQKALVFFDCVYRLGYETVGRSLAF